TRTVRFTYNGNGDVTEVMHGPGNVVTYTYDVHGNRVFERDSAGNTITRDYELPKNLLRTETRYLQADPDGAGSQPALTPVSTRYAYDDQSRLIFEVSAEGYVTEHKYDTVLRRSTTIVYAGTPFNLYDVPSLAPTTRIPREDLISWSNGLATKANAMR